MRAYQIPGVFFLFCAFVLTIVTSVSLPYLRTLDVVRTHFGDRTVTISNEPSDQLRFGVWTNCHYLLNGDRHCAAIGYAYAVQVFDVASKQTISIASSWTRGLAIHPVSAVVTIVALLFSLVPTAPTLLAAGVLSLISSLLCFIAFLVDIAIFAYAKHQFSGSDHGLRTITGPGLWVNFAAMIITGIASWALFMGSKMKRAANEGMDPFTANSTEKKSFLDRLRRNK